MRRRDNRPDAPVKRPTFFVIPNLEDSIFMLESLGGVTIDTATEEQTA